MPMLANPKQEQLARNLAMGMDRYKACKAAGYRVAHKNSANGVVSDLIHKKDGFRQRVDELQREAALEHGLTRGFVIRELMKTYTRASQASPVLDKEGDVQGYEYKNLRAANEALKLLGTEIGMFRQRHSVENPDGSGLFDKFLEAVQTAHGGQVTPELEQQLSALDDVEDAEVVEDGDGGG